MGVQCSCFSQTSSGCHFVTLSESDQHEPYTALAWDSLATQRDLSFLRRSAEAVGEWTVHLLHMLLVQYVKGSFMLFSYNKGFEFHTWVLFRPFIMHELLLLSYVSTFFFKEMYKSVTLPLSLLLCNKVTLADKLQQAVTVCFVTVSHFSLTLSSIDKTSWYKQCIDRKSCCDFSVAFLHRPPIRKWHFSSSRLRAAATNNLSLRCKHMRRPSRVNGSTGLISRCALIILCQYQWE